MNILIIGIILFGIAFFLHLIIWRIRIPESPIRGILTIFFAVYLSGMLLIYQIKPVVPEDCIFCFRSEFDFLHIFLFFLSITFAYCFVYHSFEEDSPSLFIALKVWDAHRDGISKETLFSLMPDDVFIKNRLEYLVVENLAHKRNGKYYITSKGKFILNLFLGISCLMKLTELPG